MEATASKSEVKRDRGQFIWHELMTNDVQAAIDFYGHVVGWKTQAYDFQGNTDVPAYTMWLAGESPIGGVMKIDPQTMGEMPPAWTAYVHTPNVDETVRQAQELGGNVLGETLDIPTVGRMAGIVDPQGAVIWVLQPGSSEPMPEPPRAGSFTWNELATTDFESAFDFYRRLFGWEKIDEMDMGEGWMYFMFGQGGKMYGGVYDKPADMPAPPHWLYYANVEDLDGALERVRESGGQVLNGPMEVPGGDRVAQCMDPQGAAFALHESAR